jgi:hypothetical protein
MALNPLLPDSSEFLSLLQGGRQERPSLDLYQRLLSINQLATAMTAAPDLGHLQQCLVQAYAQWIPSFASR